MQSYSVIRLDKVLNATGGGPSCADGNVFLISHHEATVSQVLDKGVDVSRDVDIHE